MHLSCEQTSEIINGPEMIASGFAPRSSPSTEDMNREPCIGGKRDLPDLDIPLLKCPLTGHLFKDPVVASDGLSYERAALSKKFAEGGRISLFILSMDN